LATDRIRELDILPLRLTVRLPYGEGRTDEKAAESHERHAPHQQPFQIHIETPSADAVIAANSRLEPRRSKGLDLSVRQFARQTSCELP
jgi:hypothetical protein